VFCQLDGEKTPVQTDSICMLLIAIIRERLIAEVSVFLLFWATLITAYNTASIKSSASTPIIVLIVFTAIMLILGMTVGDILDYLKPISDRLTITRIMLPVCAIAIGVAISSIAGSGVFDIFGDTVAVCFWRWSRPQKQQL